MSKTEIVLKQEGKNEFLYIKNAPVFFASVLAPRRKYQEEHKREYGLTVFVDEASRDKLELPVDEGGIAINKELKLVGKDRNKKKKIKYPVSSQLPDDSKFEGYDAVEGMYGMQLALGEYTKSGKKSILKVVDSKGNTWPKDKLIGNGSKIHLKCFGYRNQDDQLVVFPNVVVVVDHVPYEGSGGVVEDDVLGVTMDFSEDFASRDEAGTQDADAKVFEADGEGEPETEDGIY